jgi:hypothetical protein
MAFFVGLEIRNLKLEVRSCLVNPNLPLWIFVPSLWILVV